MRRGLVVTVAMVALLMAAMPVQAKIAGTASIRGPGIGGPGGTGKDGAIRMGGADGGSYPDDGFSYPDLAGLFERGRGSKQSPTEDLGPRYTARFVISGRSFPGIPPVVQHLYPFAEGGPLIHTAPGQEWMGGAHDTVPGGWFPMKRELLDELIARGLPEEPPVAGRAPAVQAQPQPAPSGPSPVVLAMLLLAGLLVLGAAAGRRAIVRRAA